jgi:hypothetical protein
MSKFISIETLPLSEDGATICDDLIRLVVLGEDGDENEEVQEHVFPKHTVENVEIAYYPMREGAGNAYIRRPSRCWVCLYREGWDSPFTIDTSVDDALEIRRVIFGTIVPDLVPVPKSVNFDDDEEYDDE